MKHIYLVALMVAFLAMSAFADEDPPPRDKAAKVTIITDPPNSDVYLGGELLGKSPIEKRDVKSGRQTLVVIDQGFELVNQRVNVWPGDDKRNEFNFGTKIPKGHIKVTTKPGKCLVYVDGDNSDRTDGAALTIHNLDAGDHLVCVECGNRKTAEALVTVKGEETVEVELVANSNKPCN